MEVHKYLSIWDYATDFEVVVVNLPWWNKLTPQQRSVLERVAKESVQFEAGLVKKDVKERRELSDNKGRHAVEHCRRPGQASHEKGGGTRLAKLHQNLTAKSSWMTSRLRSISTDGSIFDLAIHLENPLALDWNGGGGRGFFLALRRQWRICLSPRPVFRKRY